MINGREYKSVVKSRKDLLLEKFGSTGAGASGHSDVKAPMPGLVVRVNVAVGDIVEAGQPLLVLEAMKMENEIGSPRNGVVGAVHVADGEAVGKNALLIEIETVESQ
ncbi:MAG: acetyl-CoA carboxylase biotin carboxyl carrier protein subunit [Rhodothermales bacterium]|nr:acetyl-CoA carboxylase biotin carboxyl carrier protein subunit [Rhodothermales bacterium]